MRSGTLVLLRSEAERAALAPQLQLLRDAGLALHELDAAAARHHEPGLAEDAPLAGALQLPAAALGNCRLYALQLRQAAQELGAQFHFGSNVQQLEHSPPGVLLRGQTQAQPFDAVVLCAGSAASALARPLGLALPLAQLHGYTVSTLLRDELQAPRAAVVDASARVSIARLGQRLRIAGGAELGGSGSPHHQPTLERLYQILTDWFPGGAQLSGGVQVWRGTRSMSADGLPLLGPSTLPGLWLNCGHGDSGWALASGCAQLLTDAIAGRSPALDMNALALR
jgi:D-amino-acid dehydrogenase